MASSPSPTTSSSPSSRSPCRSAPVAGLGGLRGRHRFKPLGVSSGRLRPRARRRQRRHRTKVAACQPRVRRRPERHRPPAAHPSVKAYQRMAWLAQASSTRRPRRRRPRATARRALLGTTCQPSSAPPCLRRRETQACLCAAAPAPSPCATSLGKRPKPTFLQARNSRNGRLALAAPPCDQRGRRRLAVQHAAAQHAGAAAVHRERADAAPGVGGGPDRARPRGLCGGV